MSLFYVSGVWRFKIRNYLTFLNKKYKFKYIFEKLVGSKISHLSKIYIDLILQKEMISILKTFDV